VVPAPPGLIHPLSLGAVVYTGSDAKVALKLLAGKVKFSSLEQRLNLYVLSIFLMQARVCGFAQFTGDYCHLHRHELGHPSLLLRQRGGRSEDVPIASHMMWDRELWSDEQGHGVIANTSAINEELGQVQYISSRTRRQP